MTLTVTYLTVVLRFAVRNLSQSKENTDEKFFLLLLVAMLVGDHLRERCV